NHASSRATRSWQTARPAGSVRTWSGSTAWDRAVERLCPPRPPAVGRSASAPTALARSARAWRRRTAIRDRDRLPAAAEYSWFSPSEKPDLARACPYSWQLGRIVARLDADRHAAERCKEVSPVVTQR